MGIAAFYACPVCNRTADLGDPADSPPVCAAHEPPTEMETIYMRTGPDGRPEGDLTFTLEAEYRPD
jgi:hypothetical protein